MFKRRGGGGVKGLLNNVKKNCTFLKGWLPLPHDGAHPRHIFSSRGLSSDNPVDQGLPTTFQVTMKTHIGYKSYSREMWNWWTPLKSPNQARFQVQVHRGEVDL